MTLIYGTAPVFIAPIGGTCPTFAKLFNTLKSLMIALPYAEENTMVSQAFPIQYVAT